MRTIYNIIKKLKSLDNTHKLSDQEIKILEKYVWNYFSDLNHNDPEYGEIIEFLTMTKDKYFEKQYRIKDI